MLQRIWLVAASAVNRVITAWRFAVCAGSCAVLASMGLHAADKPYSPYADREFPTELLFGETHVHSALSADAGYPSLCLCYDSATRDNRRRDSISAKWWWHF